MPHEPPLLGADHPVYDFPMRPLRILATLLLVSCLAPLAAFAKEVLPFIDDDYAKALSLSRARHVPIFVEAWAPW
jgi:hypothetical protein